MKTKKKMPYMNLQFEKIGDTGLKVVLENLKDEANV